MIECLRHVKINNLVLISTIAVYPTPINTDEDSTIDLSKLNTYGKNRLKLELALEEKFDTTILRLPALFGQGLKKNILYDLIHKKHLEKINTKSTYQFYNLNNINRDIDFALKNNIKKLNLATHPIKISEILNLCFDYDIKSNLNAEIRNENMITKFSRKVNSTSSYLYKKSEIIDDLNIFISNERKFLD